MTYDDEQDIIDETLDRITDEVLTDLLEDSRFIHDILSTVDTDHSDEKVRCVKRTIRNVIATVRESY